MGKYGAYKGCFSTALVNPNIALDFHTAIHKKVYSKEFYNYIKSIISATATQAYCHSNNNA
jgi:hypothetical protein